jgi:hypothetical protein
MGVNKTLRSDFLKKLYVEVAEKTEADIVAEELPPVVNNRNAIQPSLP